MTRSRVLLTGSCESPKQPYLYPPRPLTGDSFLDFVSDSAPVEKRQLQITDKLFEFVCKELQIPAYFVDTVLRDDQLGRLGFGSYLHPGKDQVPGSFG